MAIQLTRTSSQYLDCGSNSVHNVTQITICAWAYADSYTGSSYNYLISREQASSPYFGFVLRSNDIGSADFMMAVGASGYTARGTRPSSGSWQHWAGTYDGETATLWTNGSSAATDTLPSGNMAAAPAGTKTYIGNSYGAPTRHWNGRLAEIGLWNRALSADEIAALADGFAPSLFPRGLISYWPLMGRISPEPDWYGGQTGSLVNTPTAADHPPKIIRSRRRNRVSGSTTAAGALEGSTTLTFSTTGDSVGTGALVSSSTLTFTTSGDSVGIGALSGSSSLTFTTTGASVGTGALVASSTLTFSTAADLTSGTELAGSTTLTFTTTGALVGVGALAASSTLTFSTTGVSVGVGVLNASTTVDFSTSGLINGIAACVANTTLDFSTTGLLGGTGTLLGNSSVSFSLTGDLALGLVGSTSLAFTLTGNAVGIGAISGTSNLTFGVSGGFSVDETGILMDATPNIFWFGTIV